ncbi:MAG TPA: M13 family metallopeptidase [Steroidobacteraceae bacterium]|nr:M13 family metallopeptidase [Steroidobacteraceae bacterium]
MKLHQILPALALAACATAAADDAAAPLVSGIDLSAMDRSVRPQDDLFRYVNGTWLADTPFPAEYASAGIGIMLFEKAQEDVQKILLEAAAAGDAATPAMQRLGDMYASFMDEARVEALGARPLAPLFAEIAAIDGPAALARFFGRAQGLGISVPMGIYVFPDARNSTHNVAYLSQSGLGMPNRDYYLREEAEYVEFRRKYVLYLAKLLELAGEADGAARAAKILELETRVATDQWTPVQNRDPIATYNRHGLESAAALAPEFDWKAFHAASGLPAGDFIVRQPTYATALGRQLGAGDLAVWKDYLKVRAIGAYARVLSAAFVEASFDFNSRTLRGTEQLRPRWKRAVQETDTAMGEAIGAEYVARHFPPEAKQRMDQLVRNLLAAFDRGIDSLEWMSAATRAEAHAKLAKINVKIGYPDKWRDYTGLEIRRDDLAGNVMRANQFEWDWQAARAGQPKDPTEWFMTPQTVNAYYLPTNNEIVFPAAFLQPPLFNMAADDAVNYGAIGSVIGHEISHGFDDKGRQYDGDGNLRDWWTAEDNDKFQQKAAGLVKQYGSFEALPGLKVNGELTLGENIGDLSGAAVAYAAYVASLDGAEGPVIDGFTGRQRFFLGYAQSWRTKWREGLMREIVLTDPHSPSEFRANGVVANMAEFYAAFGVREGDRLWRPAAERVKIW